jgi:hypothetical protein
MPRHVIAILSRLPLCLLIFGVDQPAATRTAVGVHTDNVAAAITSSREGRHVDLNQDTPHVPKSSVSRRPTSYIVDTFLMTP